MIRCAVVGASGYSGAELVALLAAHPEARLVAACAREAAGRRFGDLYPARAHLYPGALAAFDPGALAGLDVVFLALPHGVSGAAAAALHGRVGCVIDLSGDLRLESAAAYRRWYRRDHPAPELLGRAVYGLPELFGDALPGARLVACAGCYATVAQLAAAPALRLRAVAPRVVIAASSGTSGAGRKADLGLSFSEVSGDLRAYRVGTHQHAPEIARGLGRAASRDVAVTFVPHLAPLVRGIAATVILPLAGTLAPDVLTAAYRDAYAASPFVHVRPPGARLPGVADVAGTNACHVAPVLDEAGGSAVVSAAIDNLVKGAAGQAVQVMNLVHGLPEVVGLPGARPEGEP